MSKEKQFTEPLCPVHRCEMTPATHWIKQDGRPFPKPVHVCLMSDCTQAHGPEGHHQIPATEAVGNPIEMVLRKI